MSLKNKHRKEISMTIPAEFSLSPKVRELVTSFLKQEAKFSNIWIWRLSLMVDELVNNAIEHWSNGKEDNIDILVEALDDNSIKIVVKDSWKEENNITAKDLEKKVKENLNKKNKWEWLWIWVRGRWLSHIVASLSDKFYYEDNEQWWLTWTIYKEFNEKCADPNANNDALNDKIKVQTISI